MNFMELTLLGALDDGLARTIGGLVLPLILIGPLDSGCTGGCASGCLQSSEQGPRDGMLTKMQTAQNWAHSVHAIWCEHILDPNLAPKKDGTAIDLDLKGL